MDKISYALFFILFLGIILDVVIGFCAIAHQSKKTVIDCSLLDKFVKKNHCNPKYTTYKYINNIIFINTYIY